MPSYIVDVNSDSSGNGSTEFGPVWGQLGRVDVNYHASAGTLTDLSLINVSGVVNGTLLTLTNVNADNVYNPVLTAHDATGTQQVGTLFAPVQNTFMGEKINAVLAGVGSALTPAVTIVFRTWEGK